MADERLRVLIIAYACEPSAGSEPAVGWNTALGLCKHFDVWILTRWNNRRAIEEVLSRNPVPGLHVLYFDLPSWVTFWKRGQRGIQAYYYLWQMLAARIVRETVKTYGIDVVHHATFVKYWAPSAARKSRVPFVLGPVGGGERLPAALWQGQSARSVVYEACRLVAQRLAELDPAVRGTARRATIAVAATHETAERLQRLGAQRVVVLSQCSLSLKDIETLTRFRHPAHPEEIGFLAVGRLLGWKGYHLLLRALRGASISRPWSLRLVGDGPERARLERLTRALGLSDRVGFLGWLDREQLFEEYRHADVFVHPSLHDSGGQAVLEAMAAGLPVVGVHTGGTAMLVPEGAGVLVEPTNLRATIEGLGLACKAVAEDDDFRASCGTRARETVLREFSADAYSAKLRALLLRAHDMSSCDRRNAQAPR